MRQRLRDLWPFIGGGLAGFAAIPVGSTAANDGELLVAGALFVALTATALLGPWRRMPAAAVALPVLAAFTVVALLRDSEGGAVSGYGTLILLPILWVSLHGSRAGVLLLLPVVAAFFVAPILIDPARYESTEWRRALIWLLVTPVVGLTTERLVRQVRSSARLDPLTGLANRRAWDEQLPLALEVARRTGRPLSVAMLDLDGFKAYNDKNGHLAGDRLLVDAAAAWSAQVRKVDLLARLGGDEFGLLLPDTFREAAAGVVERAVAASDAPVSAGLVEWDRSESETELLTRADAALYAEKAARQLAGHT